MMPPTLLVLMLLLNMCLGTQRSSAQLRARLPRDTTPGAALCTLCPRPTASAAAQARSVRLGLRVLLVQRTPTASPVPTTAPPALQIRGRLLGHQDALLMWDTTYQRYQSPAIHLLAQYLPSLQGVIWFSTGIQAQQCTISTIIQLQSLSQKLQCLYRRHLGRLYQATDIQS